MVAPNTTTVIKNKLINLIRCLSFWVGWWLLTGVMATILMLLSWMPARWAYRYIWSWSYLSVLLFRYTLGIRYKVIGLESIAGLPPSIMVANHESTWETQALTIILPPLTWVVKFELIFMPFFGQAILLMRPIMIKRKFKFRAMAKMIEQGRASLESGRWVAIFPQGTRQHDKKKPRFHIGAATLAVETGRKIIPIVHNSGQCWGPTFFDKHPGLVTIAIGKAIEPVDEQGQPRTVKQMHQLMTDSLHQMRAELP